MNKVIGKLKSFNGAAWTKFITTALAILFALFSIVYFAALTEWDDMALSFAAIAYALAPVAIERLFRFRIQPVLYIFVIAYTVCPLLGSSYNLYLKFFWWDDMLHGFAGLLFAIFGAYLPRALGKKDVSVALCAIMGFAFSLAIAGLWEFVEFGLDSIFGTDMQKDTWLTDTRPSYLLGKLLGFPESAIGTEHTLTTTITNPDGTVTVLNGYLDIGLLDSMHDMLIETLGALIYTVIYIAFKGKKFVFTSVETAQPLVADEPTDEALQEAATADASPNALPNDTE
ncbi:MAG: hypothetical protein IJY21_02520 [Clostridia bacterium]|nr:hypothetical protein [Clostridia bacterium]